MTLAAVGISATGTTVPVVVGDVLGDRNAHFVYPEAKFRGQSKEVEGAFARDFSRGVCHAVRLKLALSESPCNCLRCLNLEYRDFTCCDRWNAPEAFNNFGYNSSGRRVRFRRRLHGSSHLE